MIFIQSIFILFDMMNSLGCLHHILVRLLKQLIKIKRCNFTKLVKYFLNFAEISELTTIHMLHEAFNFTIKFNTISVHPDHSIYII